MTSNLWQSGDEGVVRLVKTIVLRMVVRVVLAVILPVTEGRERGSATVQVAIGRVPILTMTTMMMWELREPHVAAVVG